VPNPARGPAKTITPTHPIKAMANPIGICIKKIKKNSTINPNMPKMTPSILSPHIYLN
jgi:hypothetical protein